MKKKIISLILAAVMVASLTACGDGSDSDGGIPDSGGGDDERVVELWTCWTEGGATGEKNLEMLE